MLALDEMRRRVGSGVSDPQAFGLLFESIDVLPALRESARALFAVRDALGPVGATLVGDTFDDAVFERLLRRAVAIEVITRAFEDGGQLTSGQPLDFAQLTPFAPSPVFTAKPATSGGWARPQDKLAGLGLAHFAAFYRRSWRANDFMWGRLDAAARVVDMLVSPERAAQLARDGADPQAWSILADALMDQEWLVTEALDDFGVAPGPDLRGRLVHALEADLGQTGALTRALCTRAAQLEILAEELPVLNAESADDVKLGGGSAALALPADLRLAVEALRLGPSLRERLVDPDEVGSTLAITTGTHAALVSLGVLRASGLPLVGGLFPLPGGALPDRGLGGAQLALACGRRPGLRGRAVLPGRAGAGHGRRTRRDLPAVVGLGDRRADRGAGRRGRGRRARLPRPALCEAADQAGAWAWALGLLAARRSAGPARALRG